MPFQVPTYSTGTISATTGGHDITITDGAWIVAGQTNVSPGDTLVSQNADYTIREVVSSTLLRVDPPWSGTSGGDKTFVVYKRVPTGSSELFGIISTLLSWGGAAAPFPQVYGDDGVLRWVLRNDGAGNVALFVGNSGAADNAMVKAVEINRTTGAVRFPFGAALGSATAPTYTFVGDLNTGMFSPAADNVALVTNGQTRFQINDNGRVVIGGGGSASSLGLTVRADAGSGLFGDWDGNGQLIISGSTTPQKRLALGVDTTSAAMCGVIQAMEAAATTRHLALNPEGDNANVGVGTRVPTSFKFQVNGSIGPHTDNNCNLGSGGLRFATVFAGTGTINTSDATQKRIRGTFTDDELDAWGETRPLIFRWEDAYATKGDAARLHAGLIAQDIAAAFAANGLDAARYGLWCEDAVTKRITRTVVQKRPKMRTVREQIAEIEIRDGVPTQIMRTVEREEPVTQMVAVVNALGLPVMVAVVNALGLPVMESGAALMHAVPVMEDCEVEVTEEEPDGFRLGLRYDQCAIFEAAWTRRELARLQARVEALEGSKRKPRSAS